MPEAASTSHAPRATSQQATHNPNGTERNVYDPSNQRVWKQQDPGGNLVYFYGVEGTLLATYGDDSDTDYNVYFAGRQVWAEATSGWGWGTVEARPVSPDRLGSIGPKYFPYGGEGGSSTPNQVKFATYYRDANSTLDYARNRYYSSSIARFTTPDPYRASGGPADPQSWNRYAYVGGDPVNRADPGGTCWVEVPYGEPIWVACGVDGSSSGGGSGVGAGSGANTSADDWVEEEERRARLLREEHLNELLDASEKRLIDRLDDECAAAIGAEDSADAYSRLTSTSIGFADLGVPRFATQADGTGRVSGPLGQYWGLPLGIYRSIRLTDNTHVDWDNPNNSTAIQDGNWISYRLLDAQAQALGVSSFTAAQLMDLTILHELAHSFGRNPDRIDVERGTWEDCFKW